MKKYLGGALVAILMTSAAFAAAPASPPSSAAIPGAGSGVGAGQGDLEAAGGRATYKLDPADAAKLKAWITAQKVASVPLPAGYAVALGEPLPATIGLHPIDVAQIPPSVPDARTYQFAVVGDKIVLADPTTRNIMYIFA